MERKLSMKGKLLIMAAAAALAHEAPAQTIYLKESVEKDWKKGEYRRQGRSKKGKK